MYIVSLVFQLVNTGLLIGVVVGLVLFIKVLLKLNKALNIWLSQNGR